MSKRSPAAAAHKARPHVESVDPHYQTRLAGVPGGIRAPLSALPRVPYTVAERHYGASV